MKRLKEFADELQAAGNARPYNPHNYNRIVNELNALHQDRLVELNSTWAPRFVKWTIKQSTAAAAWLKKILKEAMSR